jgi:hypothetical protein
MSKAQQIWQDGPDRVERDGVEYRVVRGGRPIGSVSGRPDGWRIIADATTAPALATSLVEALVQLGLIPVTAAAAAKALGGDHPERVPQDGARATAPHTGKPGSSN